MSWTNDIVLEFVELYKNEQILWDPKHIYHRNRSEIADAWLRIQNSLSINCTIIDLKRKKESLMTSFRMHFNKKKCEKSYRTSWFAYQALESFLSGKYECDSTNQMENEFYNNSAAHSASTQTIIYDHVNRNKNVEKRSSSARQFKTERNDLELVYAKDKTLDAVSYLKTSADEKKDMDEYELYGQLLAKKLRKLDEHQRDVAMHEIDNIMFRAKMKSGSQPRSYSTSPSPVSRKVKSPLLIVTSKSVLQYEDENVPYEEHKQLQPLS